MWEIGIPIPKKSIRNLDELSAKKFNSSKKEIATNMWYPSSAEYFLSCLLFKLCTFIPWIIFSRLLLQKKCAYKCEQVWECKKKRSKFINTKKLKFLETWYILLYNGNYCDKVKCPYVKYTLLHFYLCE